MSRTSHWVAITVASIAMGWVVASCIPADSGTFMHVPLLGAHADAACSDCHIDNLTDPLPDTCRGCHTEDEPPEHYSGDCGTCHNNENWTEVEVGHEFFPLFGGHDLPSCTTCHAEDTYFGLDPACSSCHEVDRPAEHYPGQDCVGCHNITSWEDATIDHDFFPLNFSHDLQCNACHSGETYEGLEPTCVSCHAADDPPNHFGPTCEECHNIRDWDEATFNHNRYFPIPHEGVRECSSCHLDTSNYSQFSCIDCHEHRKTKMDNEHRGNNRYRWESAACLECHPRGQE